VKTDETVSHQREIPSLQCRDTELMMQNAAKRREEKLTEMELDSAQGSSGKPFPIPKISSDFRGCSNLPETQDPESNHDHLISETIESYELPLHTHPVRMLERSFLGPKSENTLQRRTQPTSRTNYDLDLRPANFPEPKVMSVYVPNRVI